MKFHTRLVAFFALLFLVALGLRQFLTWQLEKEQLNDINADLRNIIKITHFATHKFLFSNERNKEALTRFITEAVAQHNALKEISVVNINQEIVASSNQELIGKKLLVTKAKTQIAGTLHDENQKDWYEISIPISAEQNVIGHVQASVVLSDATESLREMNLKNIAITIALFLMISAASYFGIKRMSLPLRELVTASRKVATGDFNTRVPWTGSDEHAEVAQAFNTMIEKLQEQRGVEEKIRHLEQKTLLTETAATLAHEIRNPLNMINLTAGHLGTHFQPPAPEEKLKYLDLINDLKGQVQHLNKMVKNFLDIGRPVKLNKSLFLVTNLFEQIELLTKQELTAKSLKWQMNLPQDLKVYSDPEQMRLVFLNIILNAIALSPRQGTITIHGGEVNSSSLEIYISDEGSGISNTDMEKIFEPYFSKREAGTGLGLTLARRLVFEHGGDISVKNNSGKGATFIIRLPKEQTPHG